MLHIDLRSLPSFQKKKQVHPVEDIKRSGVTLTVEGLNTCEIVTLAGSRWSSNCYLTPAIESSDQSESRCWKKNHVPAEVGPPGSWLSSLGERERKAVIARRIGGVNMLQSLFGLQLPLTQIPSNKVRIYFSKELCQLVIILLDMILHLSAYEYAT